MHLMPPSPDRVKLRSVTPPGFAKAFLKQTNKRSTVLKRSRIDNRDEEKILMGMIVSTPFCRDVLPMFNYKYLKVDYIRKVAKWALDYYKKYEEAPNRTIQDIFENERKKIDPSEAELIEAFLTKLSSEYEREENFNVAYHLDAAEEYFKKRAVMVLGEDIQELLAAERVEQAEELVRGYKKVAKAISSWKNPFDEEYIKKVFESNQNDYLFKFDGALGQLLGGFEREWLVSIGAPEKRGKTFFLAEMGVQAILSRLKTVLVSLEMSDKRISKRIYKRVTGQGDEEGDLKFPCFDCLRNQNGSCEKRERKNRYKLLDEDGEKPEYDVEMEYVPCTVCRERKTKDYMPATWSTIYMKDSITSGKTERSTKALKRMYGDNFRLIAYPVKEANLSIIKRDLDVLEYTENFIPDVVIIDYADILGHEDARIVGRDGINETWMSLKNLAQSRHCLVVTASQTTGPSATKKNVTSNDTAEDKRKRAHVDMSIFLSQTPEEKEEGVMRLSKFFRHGAFNEYAQVQILQQLDLGQSLLDSEKMGKTFRT